MMQSSDLWICLWHVMHILCQAWYVTYCMDGDLIKSLWLSRWYTKMFDTVNISCSVSKGSILGPLLFLIYINNVSLVDTLSFSILFVHVTNMISSTTDWQYEEYKWGNGENSISSHEILKVKSNLICGKEFYLVL